MGSCTSIISVLTVTRGACYCGDKRCLQSQKYLRRERDRDRQTEEQRDRET